MTTHQMWSCHVTLPSDSENFYFSPSSILNFRKSYKMWGKLAQEQNTQASYGKGPDNVLLKTAIFPMSVFLLLFSMKFHTELENYQHDSFQ